MISSNDLKPGLTILVDGEIYTVLEASQNKTARSAMVVKALKKEKCNIYMIQKMPWYLWIMKHMIKSKFLWIV